MYLQISLKHHDIFKVDNTFYHCKLGSRSVYYTNNILCYYFILNFIKTINNNATQKREKTINNFYLFIIEKNVYRI